MHCSDFSYDLPPALIAQAPLPVRSDSRLLCLDTVAGGLRDRRFHELPDLLQPDDLLVFNDTRVIPARLRGRRATGGRIEALIERILDDNRALVQLRNGKSLRDGDRVVFDGGVPARIMGRTGEFTELRFEDDREVAAILDAIGRMPLPPYIERDDEAQDRDRYQTIFATRDGAVAAPTAGLHFDAALLDRIRARGIGSATVTLHVGAGTFQPVRSEDLREHRMHRERITVDSAACENIRDTRARGGRVIAVGTTVVRALESAALGGELLPFSGETGIFITPGFEFRIVDALITNFHLPRSTLLMLVCAFAGIEPVLTAYRHAVAERYRFFSYGDAMLII
jgi:S-adenosylmethionine:tRNA ribosyltransferase-isomerase